MPVVDELTQTLGPSFGFVFNERREEFERVVAKKIAERISRN